MRQIGKDMKRKGWYEPSFELLKKRVWEKILTGINASGTQKRPQGFMALGAMAVNTLLLILALLWVLLLYSAMSTLG